MLHVTVRETLNLGRRNSRRNKLDIQSQNGTRLEYSQLLSTPDVDLCGGMQICSSNIPVDSYVYSLFYSPDHLFQSNFKPDRNNTQRTPACIARPFRMMTLFAQVEVSDEQ